VKLSDFIARKSTKFTSALPYPPHNNGEPHLNNPATVMLPLKQYAGIQDFVEFLFPNDD